MSTPDKGKGQILAHVAEDFVRNAQVSINVRGDIIVTTEDKIRLAVVSHLARMEQRQSWIAPLGILVTIVLAIATSSFQTTLGLSAATWQAVFILSGAIALALFVRASYRAVRALSPDDFVGYLRASQTPLGLSSEAAPEQSLSNALTSRRWTLVFNPASNKSKSITFLPDGTVGEGRNQNEYYWRLSGEKLELVQADGRVHSRFTFDPVASQWNHTNDPDTRSIRGQYIRSGAAAIS